MRWVPLVLALLLGAGGLAAPARAQSADELRQAGMRAFASLDLEGAVGLLREALDRRGSRPLADSLRTETLFYLGAAEVLRGNPDSARAAFERLLVLEPRYRPDRLTFPPTVTRVFEALRTSVRAVAVAVPDTVEFRLADERYRPWLYASVHHEVAVELWSADGAPLRRLYAGPIGDSLAVIWDGLDSTGSVVASGEYFLVVISSGADRRGTRMAQVPLRVELLRPDTLAHPAPPPESVFLPERRPVFPAVESLTGGLVFGAVVALLPQVVASEFDASPIRFGVAGAIGLSGLVGFLRQQPGSAIPENVAANAAQRAQWEARRDTVLAENAARRRAVRLRVVAGESIVIERAS